MGFKMALEIAKWSALLWVAIATLCGFYIFFKALLGEWLKERRRLRRGKLVRMPLFVIRPERSREQERARFALILDEHNPNLSYEHFQNAVRKFDEHYDEALSRNFRLDLEDIKPEDFR